jgi:ubiquinone biosynthesis protein Coq4
MTPTQLSTFYTTTINNLTLTKALDEHYKINPQFTPWYKYQNNQASRMIKAHDITHLIFGCDTSYSGEYAVQTWAKYRVKIKIPFWEMYKYLFNKDMIQLILPPKLIQYSWTHRSEFAQLKKKIKTQTNLMTKKWEYFQEEHYMNKTISEIREEYGIKILG